MEKHSITEQQLFDLIDGKCSADESRKIKNSIDASLDLKDQYQEFLLMHKTMSDHNIVKSPGGILDSIMSGLESRTFSVDGLFDSMNKLGIKLIVLMTILMTVSIYFVTNESIVLNFTGLIDNATLVQDYNLNSILVDSFLNDKLILNGMLFTGLIVTLILFDKAVLKPWFTRRSALM